MSAAYDKIVEAVQASSSGLDAVDDIRIGSIVLAGIIVQDADPEAINGDVLMKATQIVALVMRYAQAHRDENIDPLVREQIIAAMRESLFGLCDSMVRYMGGDDL